MLNTLYNFSSIHMAMDYELVMGLTSSSISTKTSVLVIHPLHSLCQPYKASLLTHAAKHWTERQPWCHVSRNLLSIAGEQAANSRQASQILVQDVRIRFEELHSWMLEFR